MEIQWFYISKIVYCIVHILLKYVFVHFDNTRYGKTYDVALDDLLKHSMY